MDSDETDVWDLSGVVSPLGLDRPVKVGPVTVPGELRLEGPNLGWSSRKLTGRPPSPDVLDRFVRLSDASDAAILSFAKRNGVLWLCQHDIPCTHNWVTTMQPGDKEGCWPVGWPYDCREPLYRWREVARRFRAVLTLAACLHDGRKTRREDWKAFESVETEPPQWKVSTPVAFDRIHSWVNWLLRLALVHPQLSYGSGKCEVKMGTGLPLVGHLGVQLMLAVAKTDGLTICSECGQGYAPERKPNANRNRYCSRCKRAAWKHSKRRIRASARK